MKRIAILLVGFIALFLLPTQVLAVDYSIENMEIEVVLQEDGDALVTETQTYEFFSSFNGITRTLIPKEGTSIIDFEAKENDQTLEIEQEGNLFKIFRSGKDETVTITTTYTIKNGIEVFTDGAQFYWPFFDHNNESDYENLDIIIHPPTTTTDVLAIGYDSAEDTEQIQDNGVVQFSLGYVSSGQTGDIRVVYDKSLFPSMSLTEEKSIKPEIITEQKKREDKKIAFEKRKNTLKQYAPYILGFYGVVLLALLLYARQKKQMTIADVERRYTAPYFVPDEMMSIPATLFYTRKTGFVNVEVLTVAVLDLVRKKFVEQTDEETFKVVHRNTEHKHEEHLIDWLFYKVGKDGIFTMDDLKDYTSEKSSASSYQTDYQKWRALVKEEVKQNELYEQPNKLRTGIIILGSWLFPLIILFASHDLIGNMLLTVGLFISYIIFVVSFRPLTSKGTKIKQDWDEFIDKYAEFGEKEWDELQNDDQRRAFLYGFGVNDLRIKNKNEWLLNREPNVTYSHSNPMYFLLFATIAHNNFDSAHTSAASITSSSSSSGMIGGVGGGVGGGGGGSGAF